jgi:hypothetical protein
MMSRSSTPRSCGVLFGGLPCHGRSKRKHTKKKLYFPCERDRVLMRSGTAATRRCLQIAVRPNLQALEIKTEPIFRFFRSFLRKF